MAFISAEILLQSNSDSRHFVADSRFARVSRFSIAWFAFFSGVRNGIRKSVVSGVHIDTVFVVDRGAAALELFRTVFSEIRTSKGFGKTAVEFEVEVVNLDVICFGDVVNGLDVSLCFAVPCAARVNQVLTRGSQHHGKLHKHHRVDADVFLIFQ